MKLNNEGGDQTVFLAFNIYELYPFPDALINS